MRRRIDGRLLEPARVPHRPSQLERWRIAGGESERSLGVGDRRVEPLPPYLSVGRQPGAPIGDLSAQHGRLDPAGIRTLGQRQQRIGAREAQEGGSEAVLHHLVFRDLAGFLRLLQQ